MRSTVARRLSTLASFYRYCEQEGLVERNPAANVRRPKVDYQSGDRRSPRASAPIACTTAHHRRGSGPLGEHGSGSDGIGVFPTRCPPPVASPTSSARRAPSAR